MQKTSKVIPWQLYCAFGCISLLCLAARFPYLFGGVINWDESTFILMSQEIVQGHLPYVRLWDNKPPLGFAVFALPQFFFPKSIEAVRLLGWLVVSVAACFVFLIARDLQNGRAAWLAAIVFVFGVGIIAGGQAVLTEHLTLPALTAALWLSLAPAPSRRRLFAIGVLLGTSCFIRLNLSYAALIIGASLLLLAPWRGWRDLFIRGAAYSAGGLVVGVIVFLPYLFAGKAGLWWTSVVLAPLAFVEHGRPLSTVVTHLIGKGFGLRQEGLVYYHDFFSGLVLWMGGAIGLVLRLVERLRSNPSQPRPGAAFDAQPLAEQARSMVILLCFLAGSALAVLSTKQPHAQYLLQLTPFFAVGSGILLDTLFKRRRTAALIVIMPIALTALWPLGQAYAAVYNRIVDKQPLDQSRQLQIAAYLIEHNPCRAPILMTKDQIVYWMVDVPPPHRMFVHPTTISRDYFFPLVLGSGASPTSVMEEVLASRPAFVITEERVWYIRDKPAETLLRNVLARDYQVAHEWGKLRGFRRTDWPGCPPG